MKFRTFIANKANSATGVPLEEADLLGVPSSGSSEETARPEPSQPKATGTAPTQNIGSGPPPRQSTEQLQKALALTVELQKSLATLPHPWNKQFYRYLQPLQALMVKLEDICG